MGLMCLYPREGIYRKLMGLMCLYPREGIYRKLEEGDSRLVLFLSQKGVGLCLCSSLGMLSSFRFIALESFPSVVNLIIS